MKTQTIFIIFKKIIYNHYRFLEEEEEGGARGSSFIAPSICPGIGERYCPVSTEQCVNKIDEFFFRLFNY